MRSASWSSNWPGRTRAGDTAASRANFSASATASAREPSVGSWPPQARTVAGNLSILTTASAARCDYEFVQHVPISEAEGVQPDVREAIHCMDFGDPELSPHDRAVVRFVAEVVARPKVGEDVFVAVRERLTPAGGSAPGNRLLLVARPRVHLLIHHPPGRGHCDNGLTANQQQSYCSIHPTSNPDCCGSAHTPLPLLVPNVPM
jgi:alkylhydroperoxidase family enzyme